jgi:multisubunit Na+/H+ antiporter MnhG subunit
MRDVAVAVLLVLGVAAQLLASAGIAAMRSPYARLHYTGPTVLAGAALAGAVLAREGFSFIANKGLLLAAVVALTSPVVVQAIGRAARISEHGSLDSRGADVERAG